LLGPRNHRRAQQPSAAFRMQARMIHITLTWIKAAFRRWFTLKTGFSHYASKLQGSEIMNITPYVAGRVFCLLFIAILANLAQLTWAADNPALWKYEVKGDYSTVLAGIKAELEAKQFMITGEENLAKGLENNKNVFGDNQWNTIGFDNVTAVHFCSLVFNQEVFNINMDWSVLCPFKAVIYNMKGKPGQVTVIMTRPTYLLAPYPHKRAKEIGAKIERRITEAIKQGAAPN
jgi:uncharacterized protein (DUF302 family)